MDAELAKILLNAGALGAIVAWFALIHTPRQEKRQDKRDADFLTALATQEAAHGAESERQQIYFSGRFDRLEDAIDRRGSSGHTNGRG